MLRMRLISLSLFVPLLHSANPQPISELLHRAVLEKHIPGAVIVIQQHGKKIYEEAAGYADLEHHRVMKVDDVFMIASSSKPFAATTSELSRRIDNTASAASRWTFFIVSSCLCALAAPCCARRYGFAGTHITAPSSTQSCATIASMIV